jgi:thioesterase domain-containing protein
MNREEMRLFRARRDSAAARARLTGTLIELQNRLKPKALIEEALEDLREKADEIANEAIETVKQRPFTTAAIVLAVLAWVFRAPILSAVSDLFERMKATRDGD